MPSSERPANMPLRKSRWHEGFMHVACRWRCRHALSPARLQGTRSPLLRQIGGAQTAITTTHWLRIRQHSRNDRQLVTSSTACLEPTLGGTRAPGQLTFPPSCAVATRIHPTSRQRPQRAAQTGRQCHGRLQGCLNGVHAAQGVCTHCCAIAWGVPST